MKLYFFLLFSFLSSFTSLAGSEKITKVAPQKVVYVLKEINLDAHVIILKDGSAWKTYNTELPGVGDIIKSPNGSFFVNTSQEMAHYQCKSIGTITYSPLKIETVLTFSPLDQNKDFDTAFLVEVDDFSCARGEKLFVLSNQLIYQDESFSDIDFCNWESAESLQLIRRDEIEDQEYLVCLERNEIRPVATLVYQTSRITDINLNNQMFLLEGDDRPWHTFCSYAEVMSTWDPSHLIRTFTFPELDEIGDDVEEYAFLHLLFRLQHGYELDQTVIDTKNFRIGFVMNIDTGEIILMWDWIPNE